MLKVGTKNVSYAEYDTKNPIDMAQHMMDDIQHKGYALWHIMELLDNFNDCGYLNKEGKEFWAFFEIMNRGIATNKRCPRIHYDRLLKYIVWCKEHGFKDERALRHKGEWEKNNGMS